MKNLLIFLINTGSADSITTEDCYKFITTFLSDQNVVKMNIFTAFILKNIILKKKAPSMREHYETYCKDGINPYHLYFDNLTHALNSDTIECLQDRYSEIKFIHVNSYSKPYCHDLSVEQIKALFKEDKEIETLVMPLYPQYCGNTVMASFYVLKKSLDAINFHIDEKSLITSYFKNPIFINYYKDKLKPYVDEGYHIIFSYHSMLLSYIKKGDIYEKECLDNTKLFVDSLKLKEQDYTHCYQSAFGHYKWLTPLLNDVINDLKQKGIKKIAVIAPSFTLDCSESLYEIDIEAHELFLKDNKDALFAYIPCLNDNVLHKDLIYSEIIKTLN